MRISDWSSDVCSSDLILFAQAVHMDAVDALHMLGEQLADRKAKAAAWGGGVVFGDLALAVHRIDAQPDVARPAPRAKLIEERAKARALSRRVEAQMVGHRRDLGQVAFLVAGAIGRDLTARFAAAALRFEKARRADAVEI